MRLSLLGSPVSPAHSDDGGMHLVPYALLPHLGSWQEGAVHRRAQEYNVPPIAVPVPPHGGALPPQASFFKVTPASVALTAVKRAESGDGLALLGTAAMAGYLLLARGLHPRIEVWSFLGVACAVGGAAVMAAAWAGGVGLVPSSGEAVFYIFLSALIPQVVGHGLLTWSLRHSTPTVVGLATLGEPVGSTLLAWVWLGEAAPAVVLAGCAVVLAALVIALSRRRAGGPAEVVAP